MSPALKNGLLLGAVVVLLALAAWRLSAGKKESGYPDDPATVTHWMCDKCEKHIELTAKKYNDWKNSPDKRRRDPSFKGGATVFLCPDCKTYTVVRAFVDKSTGKWSITEDSQGRPVAPPPPPAEETPPPNEGNK